MAWNIGKVHMAVAAYVKIKRLEVEMIAAERNLGRLVFDLTSEEFEQYIKKTSDA